MNEVKRRWYDKLKSDPARYAELLRKQREYKESHKGKYSEKEKQWRKDNPERARQGVKNWKKSNPEKVRVINSKWLESNKAKAYKAVQNWRENNPEKSREYLQRYSNNNPDKRKESVRRWREKNPDKIKEYARKHHNAKRNADGFHTEEEWIALCFYYMNQCLRCGEVPIEMTRDHIVPISLGGSDDISNIQPLCRSCNSYKGLQTIDYRK